MIKTKYFLDDKEIIIFDRGLTEDGLQRFRFYSLGNLPDECPWRVLDDPSENVLGTIALKSGSNVTKKYYVTPPDELEWWMGTYIYTPNGQRIHFDPIGYGSEDSNEDVSERTSKFFMAHADVLLGDNAKPLDSNIIQ